MLAYVIFLCVSGGFKSSLLGGPLTGEPNKTL